MVTTEAGRRRGSFGLAGIALAVALTCSCSASHPLTTSESTHLPAAGTGPDTTLVTVPDLVGQVYDGTAQMAVASASLVSAYRLEHSPTVAAGSVISETPAAGSRVAAGSAEDLIVSIGPASIPGARPCQAAHLEVQPGPRVSEATGQNTIDWSFLNIGAPCVLDGYPVVSALDSDRRVLAFSYTHAGDQMTTGAMPQPVYLPSGSAAWIRMDKYRCDIAGQDTATTLSISLPAGGGTLNPPVSLPYCAETGSLTIAVSPFEPVPMLLS